MSKILLVEDEQEILDFIVEILGAQYDFVCAKNLEEANAVLKREKDIELIVLDFTLPDGKGSSLCAQLKKDPKNSQLPIIFLTARRDIQDKILAYTCGADDYLTKPFEIIELDLKIKARLRDAQNQKSGGQQIEMEDLLFSIEDQKLFILDREQNQNMVDLTPIEAKLVYNFMASPNTVFSREQLIQKIWGQNIHVIDRTIDKHISRIRKKLSETSFAINAVHGSGYILEKKH